MRDETTDGMNKTRGGSSRSGGSPIARERESWHTPRLRRLGTIADMTAASDATDGTEGVAGSTL